MFNVWSCRKFTRRVLVSSRTSSTTFAPSANKCRPHWWVHACMSFHVFCVCLCVCVCACVCALMRALTCLWSCLQGHAWFNCLGPYRLLCGRGARPLGACDCSSSCLSGSLEVHLLVAPHWRHGHVCSSGPPPKWPHGCALACSRLRKRSWWSSTYKDRLCNQVPLHRCPRCCQAALSPAWLSSMPAKRWRAWSSTCSRCACARMHELACVCICMSAYVHARVSCVDLHGVSDSAPNGALGAAPTNAQKPSGRPARQCAAAVRELGWACRAYAAALGATCLGRPSYCLAPTPGSELREPLPS